MMRVSQQKIFGKRLTTLGTFFFVIVVFLFTLQAHAAITPGTGTAFAAYTTGTTNVSVNVAAGSNPILFVSVAHEFGSISSVTYAGTALTELWDQVDGYGVEHSAAWILVNPPTGVNTLSITWTGGDDLGGYAQPWYGVAQGGTQGTTWRTPTVGNDGGGGGMTASEMASNAVSGDMVLDVEANYNATPTANGSQTVQNQQNLIEGNGMYFGASNKAATGAATTMQWTLSASESWALGVIPLIPATGGVSSTTPLSAPTNLAVTTSTQATVSLSWNAASAGTYPISGYDVYQGSSQIGATSSTSYAVTGLSPSTGYTFSVYAYDTQGNISPQSNSVNVTTQASAVDTTPPSVPANLSANAISSSQVNLSWTMSTDNVGVTGYNIYRGGVEIGTSATNSYSETGLSALTNYTYTVSAYDAAGNNSAQSASVSATTQASGGTGGSQLWSGILSPTRGTNWTTAGVTDSIPSASWTQCGPTIAAYSGTTNVINAALNHTGAGYTGCAADTYIQLGAGTFNLSSGGAISNGIVFKGINNTVLRGMGASQTFLVFGSGADDGCGGGHNSAICMNGSAGAYWVTDGAATWSSGYAQGTTQITINIAGAYNASTNYSAGQVVSYNGNLYVCEENCKGNTPTTGYVPWSNISPHDTIIGLDQCSSGNAGSPCSSSPEVDTGNYWDCDIIWTSGVGGCAVNGPDGGNQRLNRPQNELFQVSAVNAATGQLTLIGSLRDPNWNAVETPQVFIAANPDQYDGVENLSVDTSAGSENGVAMLYTANSWVHGVRIVKPAYAGVWVILGVHDTVEQNYIYGTTNAPGADSFGLNAAPSSDNLFQDNIIQAEQVAISNEGADSGSVYGYNFVANDYDGDAGLYPSVFPHAGDRWQLFEGNVINSYYAENYHGPKIMNTLFRNFITGWESCANGNCGSATAKGGGGNGTTAFRMVEGSRYQNAVANVLGTPGYANSYSTTAGFADSHIYEIGSGNGSIPVDPIVAQTFFRWGNYDVVSGATRWCGSSSDTGWSTVCGSTSEVPTSAPVYPNSLPTVGDAGAGQSALPASFYLSSKPSWWGSLPWPAIGPDVSGGNVGQCSGSLNTVGKYNGVAADDASQCAGSSLNTGAWAGHVNAIPAMNCYLNVMDGPPDGTGNLLSFNAATCYPYTSGGSTPPTTSITSPLNGATVSGTLSVSASASDNVGVTSVQLYLDGSLVDTDSSAPYSFSLDTSSLSNGSHTLQTKAYDAAGNTGSSSNVSITVSNMASSTSTPQTLSASLSVSSLSGTAPMTISLTASASGTAQGTINYILYCNRSDTGINITTPSDLTVNASIQNPYTASNLCTYSSAGTYIAKVIIEEGSAAPAEAQATITVSAPPSGGGSGGGGSSSGGGGGGSSGGGGSASSGGGSSGSSSGGGSGLPSFSESVTVTTSTQSSAKIMVSTSLLATTELFYGTSPSYGSTTQPSVPLTTAYFNITGLIPNTRYYLKSVSLASGQTISQSIMFTPGEGSVVSLPSSPKTSLPPFTRNLTIGSVGSDVLELQQLLNQWGYTIAASGAGSPGHESTYFGSLTTKAVQKFQAANNISPVSGFVGPLTRAKLNMLIGGGTQATNPAPTTQPAPTTGTITSGTSGSLTTDLAPGSSGPQVTLLQNLLLKDNDYSGPITGYYGSLTEEAVQRFQTKYGILTYGSPDINGYGAVGPKTRGELDGL